SEPQDVILNLNCGDNGEMAAQLTCRVHETDSSRAARFKRMQTSDLLAVSFSNKDSSEYPDDDNDAEASSGLEHVADFAFPVDTPVALESAVQDAVLVNEDAMYMVHICAISVKSLKNVEMFGKNDPFVNLSVGSIWSFRSTAKTDAGSEALWKYDADDTNVVFEVKGSQLLATPLCVEVYDNNMLTPDVLIGKGTTTISSSGEINIDIYSSQNKLSGTVTLLLSFTLNASEQKLLSIAGKQTIHIPFVHFALDETETRKKKTYAVLRLHDWTYEAPYVQRIDGSCSWEFHDAVASLDPAVIRKHMLEIVVYSSTSFGQDKLGQGSTSVRPLLVERSSAGHPMQFGVDILDNGNRCGRIVVGAYVEGHKDSTVSLFSPRSEDSLSVMTDRDVLLEFFEATGGGGSWYDTCFWSKDVELSGWLNIDLSTDNERVTGLRVGSNGLTGSIPKGLYRLDMLTELELFGNGLTGCIPSEIGELVQLRTLLLNHNSLTGSIPVSLTKCINLEELDLSNNQLTGPIPSELAIQRLAVVNISCNDFEGTVPLSFTTCKLLKTFLCDMIPYEDEEFYKTFDWIRSHAGISKRIKDIETYQEAVQVEKDSLIAISQDMESDTDCFIEWLDGEEINSWPGVFVDDLGHIRSLKLSNSSLRGILSGTIERLQTLVFLDLSSNALEGFLPVEWGSFVHLEVLNLSANQFDGPLPDGMFELDSVRELDVSGNSLTGAFPDLSKMGALESLSLAKNGLNGPIPESIGNVRALRYLDVSFTPLSGKLPTSLQQLRHLEEMKIQMTNLDFGDIDPQTAKTVLVKRLPSLRKVSL
ncbi:FLS2, partial [Symbiodinium microadriaticum]